MKQKIVLKVHMCCDKCRSKAMKIAAAFSGVISVELQGSEKDHVVVIGDGVDTVCLARSLNKKVGCTILVSVEEVKPPTKPEDPKPPPPPPPPPCCCPHPCPCPKYDQFYVCEPYGPYPGGGCYIM